MKNEPLEVLKIVSLRTRTYFIGAVLVGQTLIMLCFIVFKCTFKKI